MDNANLTKDERRRQKRVKAQIHMLLRHNDKHLDASTKNISLLGACADTNEQILPGSRVGIYINLPKQEGVEASAVEPKEVKGEGAIVRCDPVPDASAPQRYEIGVFFSNFVGTDEETLTQFLDYMIDKEEREIQEWAKSYQERMEKKRQAIAEKRRLAAKEKARRKAEREAKRKAKLKAKLKEKKEKAKARAKAKLEREKAREKAKQEARQEAKKTKKAANG